MRNSRGRKTSDKLAMYRAATAKRGTHTRSAQMPTRTSPRKKNSAVLMSKTTEKSPSGSQRVASPTCAIPGNSEVDNQFVLNDSGEGSHGRTTGNYLKDLETIPETPPRPPRYERKRKSPGSQVDRDDSCNDSVESEKPSKKRKTFTTPPRGHGSSAAKESGLSSSGRNILSGTVSPRQRVVTSLSTRHADGIVAERSESPETNHGLKIKSIVGKERRRKGLVGEDGVISSPFSGNKFPYDRIGRARCAERSAVGEDTLDVLSVSSATISRLMEGIGSKLVSELARTQKEIVVEMRKVADSVNESVSSEMRHLEGVLSIISRGMTGVRGPRGTRKTSLNEWETKLNALTTDTDAVFNKDVLGWLLGYNSTNSVYWVFHNHGRTDVERVSMSEQTLLFSLQPGDKKFSYSGTVGTLHSEFKFTVVRNAFYNMHWDSFALFQNDKTDCGMNTNSSTDKRHHSNASSDDSSLRNSCRTARSPTRGLGFSERSGSRKMKRPSWLEKKVTLDHINEARSFLERPNQSREKKIRQTPSSFDIVSHGALRVYLLLGNYLHVRRGAVRNSFFQGLGYLLVPWSRFCDDVDQETLDIKWCAERSVSISIQNIPCTENCAFVSGSDVVTAADARNNGLLRSLFSDWPQLVLLVEHNVYVVNGGGAQRKHTGGEVTKIRRLINLIDVACDFCVEFCGVGNRETFLRAHKYALRCVMIFAVLFKAYVDKFMEHRNESDSSAAGNEKDRAQDFPDPMNLEVHGLCLKDIIPGPSAQKNLLECRCLRMTRTEYELYNQAVNGEEGGTESDGELDNTAGMVDIHESEELGIEMI